MINDSFCLLCSDFIRDKKDFCERCKRKLVVNKEKILKLFRENPSKRKYV